MARVRHRVGIVGDIGRIYKTLHEPAGLDGWWSTKSDGTPVAGQVLTLHFAELAVLSFRIETLESDRLVRLRCVTGPGPWLASSLEFVLRQDDNQVWVELVHENEAATEDDFLYFSTKWPCYLLSLRDFIESGQGRPYPNDVKIHYGD